MAILKTIKGKWHRLLTLAKWLPQAHTIDTVDSPHLYELIKEVLWKEIDPINKLKKIETRREQLLNNTETLRIKDLGTGSFTGESTYRSVQEITKNAVSSKSKCELLFSLVRYYKPSSILELGTSLGISTLYLSAALDRISITTVEGDLSILGIASAQQFDWAQSINYINASFTDAMDQLIQKDKKMDLIYIDGSHHSASQKALLSYYQGLSHDKSIWIIDDIYWSQDMTHWWKQLKSDPTFNVAIDMYHFGILYNKSEVQEKIDVKILPKKIRWKLGLTRSLN